MILILAAFIPADGLAKPTREEVETYVAACKHAGRPMKLVEHFGSDFAGLDLSGIGFGTDRKKEAAAIMTGADLSHCNLKGASFENAMLDEVDFTGSTLEDVDFSSASLCRAKLVDCNLGRTILYSAKLHEAQLTGADLSTCHITYAKFNRARMEGCRLSGATNSYWWIHFDGARLNGANLSHLQLNGASFKGASLRSADLHTSQLEEADFTGADLTGCQLHDSKIQHAVFDDVRGLTADELQALRRQSGRWRFDLERGLSRFWKGVSLPVYLLTIFCSVVLSIWFVGGPRRRPLSLAAIVVNVALGLCDAGTLRMLFSGASSVVQFNAGSGEAMARWSAWVSMWPALMLFALGCLLATVVLGLAFIAVNWRWQKLKTAVGLLGFVVFTAAHAVQTIGWLMVTAPTA